MNESVDLEKILTATHGAPHHSDAAGFVSPKCCGTLQHSRDAKAGNGSLKPFNSSKYWEDRYKRGETSGKGSYGAYADFKATYINAFVARMRCENIIEFGCGDGEQLTRASYKHYTGVDVSSTVI